MRHFNDKIIFYLCIDDSKLDRLLLKHWITAIVWNYYAQDKRIKSKLAFDAKKAAEEANKLRMKQRRAQAKEGELPLQY